MPKKICSANGIKVRQRNLHLVSSYSGALDNTVNSPKFTRQPASGGEASTRERVCERQLQEGDTCVLNQIWQKM